ncbi:MAG: thiamine pyrophosphate-binding protein [Candidatus Hermodarchaeota archaeon]
MPQTDAGKAVAEVLKGENITHVFSLPGGEILPIYDALVAEGIEIITTRHEQAAGNAADGWARVTRTPGVCLVPMGPGIVNAVPALAQAYQMGSPVVAITSSVAHKLEDMDAFEDLDLKALVTSVTKWTRRCVFPHRIAEYLQKAFSTALTGRMAPVLLDIPKDIISSPVEEEVIRPLKPAQYRPTGKLLGDPVQVKRAVQLLAKAERPVIIAGSGVYWSQACNALVKLAEFFSIPVAAEYLGVGCFPQNHPLSIGNAIANPFTKQADVILVVGARLDEFLGFGRDPSFYAEDAKFIHVDIVPDAIGKNRAVEVGIVGDAGAVLSQMLDTAKKIAKKRAAGNFAKQSRATWEQLFDILEKDADSDEIPIKPQRLMKEIREFASPESLFILDGGDTTAWAYVYLRANYPGQIIGSQGPLGHLGAGLPITIAAKLARPEKPVYLISGDGSFLFNISELDTAVRYDVPIVAIVNNDCAWGLVYHTRLLKTRSEEKASCGTFLNEHARLDKVAEGLGASGELVTKPSEIQPALKRAVDAGRPYVLDVRVSRKYMTLLSQIFTTKRDY